MAIKDLDKTALSFLLVGVGGQGTILASDILAEAGLKLGYDVKKAEIHGMSQRGGSVVSNLRWGEKVFSPIVPLGSADILVAFEKLEAARFVDYLRPGGLALVNDYAIPPITVSAGASLYPSDEQIWANLDRCSAQSVWLNGMRIAEDLGNIKTANVVIVGALCALLDLPEDAFLAAVESRVPTKYLEVNKKAFAAGREAVRR